MAFVCVQTLLTSWARRSEDLTFDKTDAGWSVVSSALTVRGRVPGISAADFEAEAASAKAGCPISRALNPGIAVSVVATLEA